VNTKNLQRVRGVKSKIAQQKTKVETVKEILEKFLDDDEDMKDMNLSSKLDYYATNDRIELQPRVSDLIPNTHSVCVATASNSNIRKLSVPRAECINLRFVRKCELISPKRLVVFFLELLGFR